MENQSIAPKPRKLLEQVGEAKALNYSSLTGETCFWLKQFIFFHKQRPPQSNSVRLAFDPQAKTARRWYMGESTIYSHALIVVVCPFAVH